MGSDVGPREGAGRTEVSGRRHRRARLVVLLSAIVVVQVSGGCEWLDWSSDSVAVDAELPATLAQSVDPSTDPIDGARRPRSPRGTTPPTTTPTSTAPPSTAPPPTQAPAAPEPGAAMAAPDETAPSTVPPAGAPAPASPPEQVPLPVEPPAPRWPEGSAQARALELLDDAGARDVAARALSLIRYDWSGGLPGWQIRFLQGRTGYRGLTYPAQRVIEVFVRPSDSAESIAHVTAHEIAHAIDVDRFGAGERSAWSAARGHGPSTPWFVHSGLSDFASGAGDFAESFAWWQTTGSQWSGHLGPPPSPTQIGLMALLTGGG